MNSSTQSSTHQNANTSTHSIPDGTLKLRALYFCSAAQRNILELRPKARYFVQSRSKNFELRSHTAKILVNGAEKILEVRPKAVYFAAQRKILELRTKALHFIQQRSEKILELRQRHLNFVQQRTVGSAATEEILELRPKPLYFIQPRTKNLGIYQQEATQLLRSENFGIYQQTKSKFDVLFCRERFWNLPTIDCISFYRAERILEF